MKMLKSAIGPTGRSQGSGTTGRLPLGAPSRPVTAATSTACWRAPRRGLSHPPLLRSRTTILRDGLLLALARPGAQPPANRRGSETGVL